MKKLSEWFSSLTPSQFVVLAFLLGSLIGAFLLKLPYATHGGISFIDAIFTSTSAICVTGLIVVDTGTKFTIFGQTVILVLIQAGGLGITTLGVLFTSVLSGSISFKDRSVIRETFAHFGITNFRRLVIEIMLFTFSLELAGAFILYFAIEDGGVFNAVFHAVSAFCNAGFSLYSTCLMGFEGDIVINGVICLLIIAGGIGFLVARDIRHYFLGSGDRLTLHSKVVLTMTAVLLAAGTVVILGIEWDNALAGMGIKDKLLASFFQSTTARTAGFNTIDLSLLSNSTIFLIALLMFIGASPGSCGGGIKTSTFAVLLSFVKNRALGRDEAFLYKRTVPQNIVSRAVTVVTASVLFVLVVTLIITTAQGWGKSYLEAPSLFIHSLFEAISAFGTVGLSLGLTEKLSVFEKIVIIITMFGGRVGPLALAIAIGGEKPVRYRYAEEQVMVG